MSWSSGVAGHRKAAAGVEARNVQSSLFRERPPAAVMNQHRRSNSLVLVILCVLILGVSWPALASDAPQVEIVDLQLGFAGRYKLGHWTPALVRLRGPASEIRGRVELIVPDGDAIPSLVASGPVRLADGRPTRVTMSVKLGQVHGQVVARFVCQGQVVTQRSWRLGDAEHGLPRPLAATDECVLRLGPEVGLDAAFRRASHELGRQAVLAVQQPDAPLPKAWYDYTGLDAVVLSTSDPQALARLAQQPAACQALTRWVRLGGRLVVSVGEQAAAVFAADSPLAPLLTGQLDGVATIRKTSAIESYCDTSEAMATGRVRITVPKLVDVEGRIEVYEGRQATELPLVVRRPLGFGEVVQVMLDLDRPPIAQWSGRRRLLDRLLQRQSGSSLPGPRKQIGAVTTIGYTDLAGQLRAALDRFEGVRSVPFWAVAVLGFVYALVIGPFDYWLVARVLKRPEATWLTFSLWVALFGGTAWLVVWNLQRQPTQINHVELIDFDLATDKRPVVRGSAWLNLYSSRSQRLDLAYFPVLPGGLQADGHPQVLLSWFGLSGDAVGGMQSTSVATAIEQPYRYTAQRDALAGFPIQVRTTRPLVARWHGATGRPLHAQLAEQDGSLLAGWFENRLDCQLTDARLFYDRWVYPIGTIAAGRRLTIAEIQQPLISSTLLTQRRRVGESDVTSAYDPRGLDVPRILELMMFHRDAGGSRYTRLTHRYQGYTDITGLLRSGRAVLVAQASSTPSRLAESNDRLAAAEVRHWRYVRFVLPVSRRETRD